MTKNDIVYYSESRVPLSLRNLCLYYGKDIKDIFDAVRASNDFPELTERLRTVISEKFAVDRVRDKYIRYVIIDSFGNKQYLKISIK